MFKRVLRNGLRALGRAHFIRFGIRDRIIRFFDNPDNGRDEVFEIPFFGARYTGNFNTFIDWSVFYYGAYAPHELQLIRDLAGFRRTTFVDIGANVGHHSLFASTLFDRVIAVEPFEVVYNKFKQKITSNSLHNVKLLTCGLGAQNEKLQFFPPQSQNTGTGTFLRERQSTEPIQLQVRNGDEIFSEEHITREAIIKIDTEGFEPLVLEGISNYISQHKPIIFFEWTQNPKNKEIEYHIQQILPKAYTYFEFISHIPSLLIFERKSYQLKKLDTAWPDGMILAVHEDDLHSATIGSFIKRKQAASSI